MHEIVPVKVLFHPKIRSGIYMSATDIRVLDGVPIGEGLFEVISRAKKVSGQDSKNEKRDRYNFEARDYFTSWAKPPNMIEPPPQSLQVYSPTIKLFESNTSPWVASAHLPWIDIDMYDRRRKILGVSPDDVRLAIKKHGGIAKSAEIAGNDPVEVRVAFLCAGPATTHPEPLEIDLRPQQVAFFQGMRRPDLMYNRRPGGTPLQARAS